MARKFNNFIDGFMQYTEGKGSPRLYRLWTAIFIVSALCERKVWMKTAKGKLYPNQYITLVGGAGIGKSLCTGVAYDLLDDMRTPEMPFHLAPSSVTKASLIDALANAERRILRPMDVPSVQSFNSLSVVSNELGVFLPTWDSEFMSTLTDLWDCKRYAETRRTSKIDIDIPNVQLNLFAATTPAQLTTLLPEGAWEQGFMSRMLIVYSGEIIHTDLFAEFDNDQDSYDKLVNDAREIYGLWGQLELTDDAIEAIRAWALAGGPPVPDHPKLHSYCSRRAAHLLKLCIVSAVASGGDLIIDLEHYTEALDWLVQLESFMPDVFKSMKVGGDGRAIDDCWHYTYTIFMKTKEPVLESRIVHFLQERVPVHNVDRILEVMLRAGLLEKQYTPNGGVGYKPKARPTD